MKSLLILAKVTIQELLRDRILYNVLLIGALVFGLGFLASRLSYSMQGRIIADFGLSAVSLSCGLVAILCGSSVVIREFERRTVALILSRPISRFQFLIGKYLGLCGVLLINGILGTLILFALLWLTPMGTQYMSPMLADALVLVFLQSCLLAALAILISTFSTASISVMLSVGLYLIGTNISSLQIKVLQRVFPNLETFSLGTRVVYQLPVPTLYMVESVVYGILWIAILLFASGLLIESRDR